MKLTGGQIVAKALRANGVDYVAGTPGDGSWALVEALLSAGTEIPFIQVMQEQSSVHIADGYFRACGRPMAVLLPVPLGISKALGGIAAAWADSSAILVISTGGAEDDLPRLEGASDGHLPDALDSRITKGRLLVPTIEQLPQALRQAFDTMLSGCGGPVNVDIPVAVQSASIELSLSPATLRATSELQLADPWLVERAAKALCGAARPVILVSGGIIAADASPQLLALAERLLAPVVTTMQGKGAFAEDHPLSAGVIHQSGSSGGDHLLASADVVLVLGCQPSHSLSQARNGVRLAEQGDAQFIAIDSAPHERQGGHDSGIRITADIKSALTDLVGAISSSPFKALQLRRTTYCREIAVLRKERESRLIEDSASDVPPLIIHKPLAELRAVLERDSILVVGGGSIQTAVSQMFPVYCPRTHLCAGSVGTMGWAIPAAIGAKLAMPARQVVCAVGQGDFLQSMQEMAVCVMHSIPVVFLVFNSSGYVSLSDVQTPLVEQYRAGEFNLPDGKPYSPDFAGIAKNFGLDAWRVEHSSQLNPTFIKALNSKGPSLVEVITARVSRGRNET
ncbi:thiamine pyrophosphate-binding protein [Pseudomonas sp.]|uniref:thiamine pyrophosphate-binding protein n=1 Tax=Pseudomonas sp. TaxID=306 RepID=UPI00260F9DC7|nr:thiamine pyrophosphate-binding protein [Pseudomonas sp.]